MIAYHSNVSRDRADASGLTRKELEALERGELPRVREADPPAEALVPGELGYLPERWEELFGGAEGRNSRNGAGALPPDPVDEADALEGLSDQITILSAHRDAVEHRLLLLIAEFDRREGWTLGGYRNCSDWLHCRTGLDVRAARERVRVARALDAMPLVSAAMARGELSFSKVRALGRLESVMDEDTEEELLEFARSCTAAELEKVVRKWRLLNRKGEAELERLRHETRRLAIFPDEEGMYTVRGKLDPEVGALLMRAVEAASDALYRREQEGEEEPLGPERPRPEQRRADALGLLAELAMRVGFGEEADGREADAAEADGSAEPCGGHGGDERDAEGPGGPAEPRGERGGDERDADGLDGPAEPHGRRGGEMDGGDGDGENADGSAEPPARKTGSADPEPSCTCSQLPISGTRAERYQVFLHLDPDTLAPDREPGRSYLEDGTRLSAETARRLACDAAVVPVKRGPEGEVLDVGRRTRTVPPTIRRALEVRDGGCRFPGCTVRFCDAHHVVHWAQGGTTSMGNLLLLCRFHHRALHEGRFTVKCLGDERFKFYSPEGWPLGKEPPCMPIAADDPVLEVIRRNRRREVRPNGDTCGARYERDVDIPDRLLERAFEVVDPSE